LALLTLFYTPIQAIDKIYSIKCSLAIVADDSKWTCNVSDYRMEIAGKHHYLPLEFKFSTTTDPFENGKCKSLENALLFLDLEAKRTTTVFSNTHLKMEHETFFCFVGDYFDNISSGCFAYYFFKNIVVNREKWYEMFVKLGNDSLDEFTKDSIFQETFGLIRSVVNVKDSL